MLGRYDRAMRARQPVGRLTLLQQAIAAIRRNNGALFYVPQNFAGAWTDSAGTDPVNEIADVIGRMTDRTGGTGVATQATTANKPVVTRVPKRLGPNLVVNGDGSSLAGWTGSNGYSVVSGAFKANGTTAEPILQQNVGAAQGKTYQVTFTQAGRTEGNCYLVLGGVQPAGTPSLIGAQQYSFLLTPTTTAGTLVFATPSGAFDGSFDNISVQEVLEWTNAISFDGSNDSLTTNITTGNEGWVCVGVVATDSNATVVCSGAGSAPQKGIWMYRTSADDRLNCMIGNGTSTINASAPSVQWAANTSVVVEALWYADAISVGVNGTYGATTTRAGNASPSPTLLRIGAYTDGVTYPLAGKMAALVYCPVAPSAADRAIIRKWIGSLQGQTL